jgi:hypothetical protein
MLTRHSGFLSMWWKREKQSISRRRHQAPAPVRSTAHPPRAKPCARTPANDPSTSTRPRVSRAPAPSQHPPDRGADLAHAAALRELERMSRHARARGARPWRVYACASACHASGTSQPAPRVHTSSMPAARSAAPSSSPPRASCSRYESTSAGTSSGATNSAFWSASHARRSFPSAERYSPSCGARQTRAVPAHTRSTHLHPHRGVVLVRALSLLQRAAALLDHARAAKRGRVREPQPSFR